MSGNCTSGTDGSDFDFAQGDTVLVRIRENGTRGNIVAKFEAECLSIRDGHLGSSQRARFRLPWGTMQTTTLRYYEAEFEVVR